jgi:hypothetical protein
LIKYGRSHVLIFAQKSSAINSIYPEQVFFPNNVFQLLAQNVEEKMK